MIEFATSFGKFNVPVMATLPEHVLEFPKTTDFDLCPIRETASKTFVLKNTGELSSHYLWDIPKPFSIYPKEGHLAPGASTHVTIEFKPDNASVYTATAVCTFGDSNNWDRSKGSQAMTVYGIGKYSYISVADNQRMFDFGDVYATKSGEKKLILRNDSAVHANFKIKTVAKDSDPYFVFSATSGTIAKGKQTELLVNLQNNHPQTAFSIQSLYFRPMLN